MKFLAIPGKGIAVGLLIGALLVTTPEPAEAGPEPFIGDIISVGFGFCPRGWMSAEGQLLQISNNTALFSLYGTQFGGNGQTTFAIPDLRGRVAMGQGRGPGLSDRHVGQQFGNETQTLSVSQMPSHSHAVNANNLDGDFPGPGDKLLAAAPPSGEGSETIYSDQPPNKTMASEMIGSTGEGNPISVQDPYLTMRYCVASEGVYPPRN